MDSSKSRNYYLQTTSNESIYVENNFDLISSPKGQLFSVHGMGTYAGWFNSLADVVSSRNIAFNALDLPGFGRSGHKGSIHSYKVWLEAISLAWNTMNKSNSTSRTYLLGHSLGAVLALATLPQLNPKPSGLILTSPGFAPNLRSWSFFNFLLPVFYKALTKAPGKVAPPFPPEVFTAIQNGLHPLGILTPEVEPKLLLEMSKVGQIALWSLFKLSKIPLLMILPEGEIFCVNGVSRLFFRFCNSPNKKLVNLPGLTHDLFVLPEANEVNSLIVEWMENNIHRENQ